MIFCHQTNPKVLLLFVHLGTSEILRSRYKPQIALLHETKERRERDNIRALIGLAIQGHNVTWSTAVIMKVDKCPTEHLADVRLDVHVLEVLVGVRVVQPQGRVQPDRDPHPVADPGQLTDLALLPETH